MAEAAISSVVELLDDLLIQKVKSIRGVEGKVTMLKDELKRMQSFLKDANNKQAEDERVRNWISEIREVAQDAEDAIEMFLLKVENPRRAGLIKRCTGCAKRMYHLDRIGDELESIRVRLDAIDKSRETFEIKDLGEGSDSARRLQVESLRRLAHWKEDELVVGMEDDVEKLLRESILDEEKKGFSIAVVEGMGGVGKSTLARTVYNDSRVTGRFQDRAWVVVSSDFTLEETIKQLILELPGSDTAEVRRLETSTKDKLYVRQKLQELLHKRLEGKKFFIVLDDLWEEEHWESLKNAFPNEQDKTSRLLITTRNNSIVKYGEYGHKMKGLDSKKSWELFLKKAFINKSDGECPQDLDPTGRQIVAKCDGLPLAISVAGGLLVGTETKSGWEQVLNQINSHLGGVESNVSAILELSYQNLSPQLRSCFLCLGFFKKDSVIPVRQLVNIWAGQGLIQKDETRTMKEIGRSYLDELISRNMVQITDWTVDELVKRCHIHDLLREVCLRKANEEMGFQILNREKPDVTSESSHKTRHCVLYGGNLGTFSLHRNKHLRSLFLYKAAFSSDQLKSFQLLKTLNLHDIELQRFPHSLRALVGLKYLRIQRFGSHILKLPSWLDHLTKLEVLDIDGDCVKLPNVALKMDRLRYFNADGIDGLMSIDSWENIETLKFISQESWMRCSSGLKGSCHVPKLGIWLQDRGVDELSRLRVSLENMENLVQLYLRWETSLVVDPTICLLNLGNLTKLKLNGKLSKCPTASVFPPNLSYLALMWSFLDEDPMVELGKLPKLLHLHLSENAYRGQRMQVLHDGFPCLKVFSIRAMSLLRAIHLEEGGMPYVKQIRIKDCSFTTENWPKHMKDVVVYIEINSWFYS